ncbi:MAG TPA: hypothetical protein VMF65_12090, partial [Acidimicrobiales bacterium]|nr:hypothetical protein [Acidimicrobiales bacterium]
MPVGEADTGVVYHLQIGFNHVLQAEAQPALTVRDGMVVAICSVLRQSHTAGVVLSDMASSTLAHRLAQHLVTHYGSPRGRPK